MHKIKCRCGASEKTFKFDIGPFFMNECCEKAGYDEKGELKDGVDLKDELAASITREDLQAVVNQALPAPAPKPPGKPGRGKLMDTNRPILEQMARDKGIQGIENMNKRALVEALLA